MLVSYTRIRIHTYIHTYLPIFIIYLRYEAINKIVMRCHHTAHHTAEPTAKFIFTASQLAFLRKGDF